MALNLETLQIQFEIRDNTGSKLKKLQKQLAGVEDPEIDVNTQEAEKKIKELQKTAEDLEIEAEIDADTKGAKKKIDDLEKEAKSISGATVEIGGDKSGFDAVLKTVQGAAENINAGSADIGGDKSGFDTVANSVSGSADDIDAGAADIGGDKSGFDDVAASVKGAAENIDAGNADIGGDKSGFEAVVATVKGAADDINAGSADIGGDKSGFDTVLQTVKGAAENINAGSAGIGGDKSGFESVKSSVEGAADGIDAGSADIGGDKSAFTVVVSTLKGAADGIDAGSANIGGDKSGFESVAATVKGAADGIDAGSANIGGDKSGFDSTVASVRISVGSLPGGSVTISGFAEDALNDIQSVIEKIGQIPKDPTTTPKVNTNEAEKGLRSLWNTMKAIGLVAAGKKAFEFAMSTVDDAYAGQSVENRIMNLGGNALEKSHALDRVYGFTGEMNEKYGFNESSLAGMVANFAAAYKGLGQNLDTAVDSAVEMANLAIDTASALDKTPGEIADLYMSVIKGNTEVADSAGIFGMTIDSLNDRIDETLGISALESIEKRTKEEEARLKELKEYRDKNIKLLQAEEFLSVAKENASSLGYTGDLERTQSEFGNQRTKLTEQWKTLREDIGEFLLPAATDASGALNTLMTAVSGWMETLGQSSFTQELTDYFGTATMSQEQQKKIVDGIVGPIKAINEGVANEMAALDAVIGTYKQKYSNFSKLLELYYGTGEVDESNLMQAFQEMEKAGVDAAMQSRMSLTEMFLDYTGTSDEWNEAREAGIAGINSYYDGMIGAIEEKHAALEKALKEAMEDGVFSSEEKANLTRQQQEAAAETLQVARIEYRAATMMELDRLYASGSYSAESLDQLFQKAREASSAQRKQMEVDYNAMAAKFYAIAEWERIEYEKDPEAYIAKYGRGPATAAEMLEGAKAEQERALAQMDADLIGQLARFSIGGVEKIAAQYTEGMDFADFLNKIGAPMEQFAWLALQIGAAQSQGLELAPEALALLDYYNSTAGYIYQTVQSGNYNGSDRDLPAVAPFGIQLDPYARLMPNASSYISDPFAGIGSGIDDKMTNFANDLSGALESIPDKIVVESHVYVGGYELGKATEEATITYNTSTGSGNN